MLTLAERLAEALGENLFCIGGATRIHRTWFRVVHPGSAKLPTQMCRVIRDAVAIFDESVDLSWRPGLAVFENRTEFVELCWGELRRPAAAEAGAEPLDTAFIPCVGPPTRRGSGDLNAVARRLARITLVEVLHETQPPDETGLVAFRAFSIVWSSSVSIRFFIKRPRGLLFIAVYTLPTGSILSQTTQSIRFARSI